MCCNRWVTWRCATNSSFHVPDPRVQTGIGLVTSGWVSSPWAVSGWAWLAAFNPERRNKVWNVAISAAIHIALTACYVQLL